MQHLVLNNSRARLSAFAFFLALTLLKPVYASAQGLDAPAAKTEMSNQRLEKLITLVDADFKGENGFWELTLEGVRLQVVTDQAANRMRILTPIVKTSALTKDELYRLLQANFDSALDARYAIADGLLWGTFIHPLSTLDDQDFILGLGQTANVSLTYGASFTSGLLIFRGGDSDQLQRELMERLRSLSDAI